MAAAVLRGGFLALPAGNVWPEKGPERDIGEQKRKGAAMSLTIIDVIRPEVEDYLDFLRTGKNISDSTAVSYGRTLADFYDYVMGPEGPGSLEETAPLTLLAYEERLRRNQYASVSLAGAMGTVCGFLRWLYEEDRIPADPAASYERPKASPAPVRVLTLEELSRLFAAPDPRKWIGIRDRAMLELMYAAGLRAGEIPDLRISQVDLQISCVIRLSDEGERLVPFGERARKALLNYRKASRKILQDGQGFLFVSRGGSSLTRQSVWKTVRKYGRLAGIEGPVSPGDLRSSLAVHLLENGADPDSVREILDCRTPEALARYRSLVRPGGLREVYARAQTLT